jgi:hypothetical protein
MMSIEKGAVPLYGPFSGQHLMMSQRSRVSRFRRYAVCCAITLLAASCGSSTPNTPTPGLTAPTLSSPQDDAVATGRPSLTVNNATSAGGGARTYDFQVALTEAALTGPADALFAAASAIAEGAAGRTSFEIPRDLQTGRRYYWRSRAAQGGAAGPWSSTFKFRTEAGANAPPVIQAITVSNRAESGAGLDVTAVVQDQETSPANLVYEWVATGGSVAGTGAGVRWTVPAASVPTPYDLTLTVIERYTVAVAGGADEARENRVSGKATAHVNDSTREITTLATTFIDDFLHSERSPESCVRNFSDSCSGKQDELRDIRDNRARFVNNPAASSMGTASTAFYDSGSVTRRMPVPPSQAGFAELLAPCRFASTTKATGVSGIAVGTCQLTYVYENWQWRLCDSHFLAAPGSTAFAF